MLIADAYPARARARIARVHPREKTLERGEANARQQTRAVVAAACRESTLSAESRSALIALDIA